MSVLIKGMKMPRYCAECDAVNDEELLCPFTNDDCENYFRVRNRNCPLSPVPPHGRLIDADVLIKSLSLDEDDAENGASLLMAIFIEVLKAAPTIIPAEEE